MTSLEFIRELISQEKQLMKGESLTAVRNKSPVPANLGETLQTTYKPVKKSARCLTNIFFNESLLG